jgi:hypothetical protein
MHHQDGGGCHEPTVKYGWSCITKVWMVHTHHYGMDGCHEPKVKIVHMYHQGMDIVMLTEVWMVHVHHQTMDNFHGPLRFGWFIRATKV